jgi:hypothetical protein
MLSSYQLWSLIIISQIAHAVPFFTNTTLPANLTTSCQNALLTDVAQCPLSAARFTFGSYYPGNLLFHRI